jgi:hypothetical protein
MRNIQTNYMQINNNKAGGLRLKKKHAAGYWMKKGAYYYRHAKRAVVAVGK